MFQHLLQKGHLDVLFQTNVFSGSKYCPTFMGTVDLSVPHRNFTDLRFFKVDHKLRNWPSTRCASAANALGQCTDIVNKSSISINVL